MRPQVVHARRVVPQGGLTLTQLQAFIGKLPKGARVTVEEGQLVALCRPTKVDPDQALRLSLPAPWAGARHYAAFLLPNRLERALEVVAHRSKLKRPELIEGWLKQALARPKPPPLKHPAFRSYGSEGEPVDEYRTWVRLMINTALLEKIKQAAAERGLGWSEWVGRLLIETLINQAGYALADLQGD